jgi:hypothetical protein
VFLSFRFRFGSLARGAAAVVLLYVPFQLAVLAGGMYAMRPPSWRVVPGGAPDPKP